MNAWHQRNLLESDFPFALHSAKDLQFPPHWHKEIEIIYVLEGQITVGINNDLYILEQKDILLIGGSDIHSFLSSSEHSRIFIIQFNLDLLSPLDLEYRKFAYKFIGNSTIFDNTKASSIHNEIEQQILSMIDEYTNKYDGFKMSLKARIYDLLVILIRHVPMRTYTQHEKNRRIQKLERLDKIFKYVENNYHKPITLEQAAQQVNLSTHYFSRFFKNSTGITFSQYLSSFRIKQAEWYLLNTSYNITEIALKCGFGSIKTFNRVFKFHNGWPPSTYRANNI